ncbi:uncharacterized protein LOC111519155 [Drosophila willistoni]|uniref:uncharacterized protein LOC111519155 n=1 Tax=Drosophila willistoni TaxID=7260 RepID=UPI001F07D044|nr:uncharacterized protein LOC111519155 [Drosophila willistoni]
MKASQIFYISAALLTWLLEASYVKLTNAVCESYNKSWVLINNCRLKAVERRKTVLNINITLLYPANDIRLHIQLMKKANGYKPWLVNYTIDACQFMRRRNHPVVIIFHNLIKNVSTVNHTCPYQGVQLLKDFYRVDDLPLAMVGGEYVLLLTWIMNKRSQFMTNVYFSFEE